MLGIMMGTEGSVSGGGVNYKSEMQAVADAFHTRITSTDTDLETAMETFCATIGADPLLYKMVMACPPWIYPMYPGTEAQAIVPLIDNTVYAGITDDKLQKLNSPTYSAALGMIGDGISGSYYIGEYNRYWGDGVNSLWYRYVTQLNSLGSTSTREGAQTNSTARLRITGTGIWEGRTNYSPNHEDFVGKGWLVAHQIEYRDSTHPFNIMEGTGTSPYGFNSYYYNDGDYTTPVDSYEGTLAGDPYALSNRYYYLNAFTTSVEPTPPGTYSDHALGMIAFTTSPGIITSSVMIAFAEACDQLQADYGR